MPFGGLLIGGIGALAGGIGGALSGAGGARPPSLDPTQQGVLDKSLQQLSGGPSGPGQTPTIDPVQQKLLYAMIANNATGANTRTMHDFAGAGLGHSGLMGYALNQNSMNQSNQQNQANLGLQQQAIQQRNQTIQQIIQMLGVGNIPGQSPGLEGAAGAFNGIAGPLAMYSILKGGGGGGGGGTGWDYATGGSGA